MCYLLKSEAKGFYYWLCIPLEGSVIEATDHRSDHPKPEFNLGIINRICVLRCSADGADVH